MIRTLIADDESLSRDSLRILLGKHSDIKIIGECSNGQTTIAQIRKRKPDLLFLDVQMPGLDGFDVVRTIGPAAMPAVVFVTAYEKYALRAFDEQAVDYLLKPFTDDRFEQALSRARRAVAREDVTEMVRRLAALIHVEAKDLPKSPKARTAGQEYIRTLSVRSGKSILVLPVDEIEWIEASDYYVEVHARGKSLLLRQSINDLESKLDPHQFVRIHRSVIVKRSKIREISAHRNTHTVVLDTGQRMRISRRRLASVKNALLS